MGEIGFKIRELRKHRGIILKEFSQKVGVTPSLISQVERGVAAPSISTLKMISNALGFPSHPSLVIKINLIWSMTILHSLERMNARSSIRVQE